MPKAGKKDELVERIAECLVLGGVPPLCSTCDTARLKYNRTTGQYACPGFFDETNKRMAKCKGAGKDAKIDRVAWTNGGLAFGFEADTPTDVLNEVAKCDLKSPDGDASMSTDVPSGQDSLDEVDTHPAESLTTETLAAPDEADMPPAVTVLSLGEPEPTNGDEEDECDVAVGETLTIVSASSRECQPVQETAAGRRKRPVRVSKYFA
eukprot:TRINITY_DN17665_c0_g1_i1.p1 TRINITY_DN17665_c0_g1~~TRINITY_DN17665_c0_g1_i1.p1  ORF type:complete len:208 (-),score=40.20 TRINITY_DN17665_c0_g1_i1:170-793(-)